MLPKNALCRILMLCLTLSIPLAPGAPAQAGDPYGLDKVREYLSSETPPAAPLVVEVGGETALVAEYVGTGRLVADEPREISGPAETEPVVDPYEPDPGEIETDRQVWRVFNTRTKLEFRLTLGAGMLTDIHEDRESRGLTRASHEVEDPERVEDLWFPILEGSGQAASWEGSPGSPGVVSAAWNPESRRLETRRHIRLASLSNAHDSREIKAPTTTWPWRAIAHFRYSSSNHDSRCSGTFIGPRHLITAAHCINAVGTNTWFSPYITPAKDGAAEPYGVTRPTPNPAPGTEVWYFTPEAWRQLPTTPAWPQTEWDWGLVVEPERLGELTSWMGYVARSGNSLKQVTNLNRGYPKCDGSAADEPKDCEEARLYGDTKKCTIGNFYWTGGDGWNRAISHSCDGSGGHSGSPVYHYFYDSNLGQTWPVVSMVNTWSLCLGCTPADDTPTVSRRITPGDLGVISWLRSTFP